MVRFLFLGEVVGKCGINALKNNLSKLKEEYNVDYTIANGEGATQGYGLGVSHAIQIAKAGVDLITGGEKLFNKKDMVSFFDKNSFILRAANYPQEAPGRSIKTWEKNEKKFVIINLQGSSLFTQCINNPFTSVSHIIKKISEKDENTMFLIHFHSSITAEKKSMLFYLDGKAQAVIGTHTKVLTADETVTEKGTAYITDTGRVGSFMSVGGFESENEILKLKTSVGVRSVESEASPTIQAALVEIDEEERKCVKIERISRDVSV